MGKNKGIVMEYLNDTLYYLRHNDEDGLKALKEEGAKNYVTLEDIGQALIQLVDELAQYVDVSQAITEARLKAIVENLPKEIQMKIYASFIEAEDDLFIEDEEGEEEDNE